MGAVIVYWKSSAFAPCDDKYIKGSCELLNPVAKLNGGINYECVDRLLPPESKASEALMAQSRMNSEVSSTVTSR